MKQFMLRKNLPFNGIGNKKGLTYVMVQTETNWYALYSNGQRGDNTYPLDSYNSPNWYELDPTEFWQEVATNSQSLVQSSLKKCSCNSHVLFHSGCQCGGI